MSATKEFQALTKREAKQLIKEIADRCEAAYRRGAQQAIALELSEEDAAWYRDLGQKHHSSGIGLYYQYANAMPEGATKELRRKRTAACKEDLTRSIEANTRHLPMIEKVASIAGVRL